MIFLTSLLLAVFVLEEPWNWVVVALGGTLEIAETALFFWWSKRRKSTVGADALVGRKAVVSVECRPYGQVRIVGEIWQARCDAGASVGEEVVVRRVDGLLLLVEPSP